MNRFYFLLLLLCLAPATRAQGLYFPPNTGTAWDTVAPASLGWCTDSLPAVYSFLEERNTKAFLILHEGKIAVERYFGTFTRDSLWYWASAGKTLTAFTVGMAQQEGYLKLSDTTAKFLGTGWTACPPDKEEKITIRHQLTMTSGLNDGVPDHYCTLDTCLQYLADAGTRWAYHNGPYTLLDGVVAQATGSSLNVYFTNRVRNRIGMNGGFFPSGYNNLYISNARSMARFGLMMLNRGIWKNDTIMRDTGYFRQMTTPSQLLNRSYGYLWWLNGQSSFMVPQLQWTFSGMLMPHAPTDLIAALGKNGQILDIVPSRGLVLVRMGDAPTDASEVPYTFNDMIWERLNPVFCTTATAEPSPSPAPSIRLWPNPASEWLTVEGAPGASLAIYTADGRKVLHLQNLAPGAHIPLHTLDVGLYSAVVETAEGRINLRFAVVR